MAAITALFLAGFAVLCEAQALPEEVLLLARIRAHVKAELAQLNRFSCLQTSRRYRIQGSKNGKKHRLESSEVLTLEVARIGGNEVYAWPGASPFENRRVSEIAGGGLTASGDFSTHLRRRCSWPEGR
jgi:hypothetical protein